MSPFARTLFIGFALTASAASAQEPQDGGVDAGTSELGNADAGSAVSESPALLPDAGAEVIAATPVPDAGTPLASTTVADAGRVEVAERPSAPPETATGSALSALLFSAADSAMGGPTLGTGLLARPHAALGYVFGSNPATATGKSFMRGFSYEERGGLLAMIAGSLLAAGSAQEAANRSGEDTRIRYEGVGARNLGANLDLRVGDGGQFRSTADLYLAIPLSDGELPLVVDGGFMAGFQNGPFIMGVMGHLAVPLTRWAQGEVGLRLDLMGGASEANAGVLLNLTNRFYARGGAVYGAGGLGYAAGLGVRL